MEVKAEAVKMVQRRVLKGKIGDDEAAVFLESANGGGGRSTSHRKLQSQ